MALVALADVDDVAARLGRDLTVAEDAWADPGLLEEASVKVLNHLGVAEDYFTTNTPPATIAIVTSRMVARVLTQAAATAAVPVGADQTTQVAGPFTQMQRFTPGATSGGPWLTKADMAELDQCMGNLKAFAIDTSPSGDVHAATCSLVLGALYCDCGAVLYGVPIFGIDLVP